MKAIQSKTTEKEWDNLVFAHGGAIQQTTAYAQSSDRTVVRLEFHENGECVGLVQVMIKRYFGHFKVGFISMGPIWFNRASADRIVFPSGLAHLFVWTPAQKGCARGIPLMTGGFTAELDINESEDQILSRMHVKWRNRLRVAMRSDIHIQKEPALDWILDRELENRKHNGYHGLPLDFIKQLSQSTQPFLVVRAVRKNQFIAGGLFLIHGSQATYQIGWSGGQGRKLNAQNFVIWSAVQSLKAMGVSKIDLGLVDTEGGAGLARFKLGTGARLREFAPTVLHLNGPIGKFLPVATNLPLHDPNHT